MPGVAELRDQGLAPATPSSFEIVHFPLGRPPPNTSPDVSPPGQLPEQDCLWLPSAIPVHLREHACAPGLVETEKRMQLALMDDSLADLCRQLRISSTIRDQKKNNGTSTSQRVSTRTQNVLHRFAERTERCAVRYRAAHAALLSLDPEGDWKERLKELKPEDVRSPHRTRDDDEPRKKKKKKKKQRTQGPTADGETNSEGRRQHSWIWLRNGPLGRPTMDNLTPEQINDGMYFPFYRFTPADICIDLRAEWA